MRIERTIRRGMFRGTFGSSFGMLSGVLTAAVFALTATSAVAEPVEGKITLEVEVQGLAPVGITSPGSVDVTGSTISIAAGAVTQGDPIVVPVTGSTAIQSITAVNIANLAGTFSVGGLTAQLPAEVCAAAPAGEGCNEGGGVGGAMGITGSVIVQVIAMVVEIPVNLNGAGVGQGGEVLTPFTFDNGGWTTGLAFVRTNDPAAEPTPSAQFVFAGGEALTADGGPGVSLVTATFLSALGNILPVIGRLIVPVPAPEPGAVLQIVAGAGGLLLVGFLRRR